MKMENITEFQRIKLMLENDIDVKNRIIFLISEIDNTTAETVIKGIDFLSSIGDDLITIKLSSYGGDPYMGLAIHDAIRGCRCPISTVISGACMSAAVLVAVAGDKGRRIADPNTSFMYHAGTEGFIGDINNFIATAEHSKDFKETCVRVMTARTRKRRKFWMDLENKGSDTYFKPEEAKKWGVVDEIKEMF